MSIRKDHIGKFTVARISARHGNGKNRSVCRMVRGRYRTQITFYVSPDSPNSLARLTKHTEYIPLDQTPPVDLGEHTSIVRPDTYYRRLGITYRARRDSGARYLKLLAKRYPDKGSIGAPKVVRVDVWVYWAEGLPIINRDDIEVVADIQDNS